MVGLSPSLPRDVGKHVELEGMVVPGTRASDPASTP